MHSRTTHKPSSARHQPVCAPPPRLTAHKLSRRTLVATASTNCPYSTLGVAANASDTEIKQAYRKLVLQYHPDVAGTGTERKFMSIQQAYELLTGKARKDDNAGGQRGDWDFHDWYWSFMQKRRWSSKRGAPSASARQSQNMGGSSSSTAEPAGTPFHQHPEHKSTIRSQLAGLRHRAAVRAHKTRPRWTAAAAEGGEPPAEQQEQQPEATASLDYDSTEMSDGCNMASGVTDWEAAAAVHAATAAKQRFCATESHKQQVMSQVAGLHRMAATAAQDVGGPW